MGTYLFIVFHAPPWSLLPCRDYCSPLVLVSLQIWLHAGGSESIHGETGSHPTWSECSSFKEKILPMICWCNCNFGMYSLVFLMYCNLMFISGCICNVLKSCHTPMFIPESFYNVNKSCQVTVGNPPICQGLKSP